MNKRRILVFVLAFLFAMAMLVTLAGCGGGSSNPSKFVGEWIPENPDPDATGIMFAFGTMELNSDGTGLWLAGLAMSVYGAEITWEIEDGRFTISFSDSSEEFSASFGYELKGSKLTLTDEDGNRRTYNKK